MNASRCALLLLLFLSLSAQVCQAQAQTASDPTSPGDADADEAAEASLPAAATEEPCGGDCQRETPERLAELGAQYATGNQVPENLERAAQLFSRACASGHARACSNLGVLYHEGKGVVRDDREAAARFAAACDASYAPACFNLALLEDSSAAGQHRARSLFQKACSGGYDAACNRLRMSNVLSSILSVDAPENQSLPSRYPPCHMFARDPWPEDCWTPRVGVVSGGFLGFDVGYAVADKAATRRISAGEGYSLNGRLGIELWDQLLVTLSFGSIYLSDKAPTTEEVVNCRGINSTIIDCDDTGYEQDSVIKDGYASYEAGYQYRFRPLRVWSIAPAALAGYMNMFHGLKRQVECRGCPSGKRVDIDIDGAYLTGLLRMTFGQAGIFSTMVRSQWFLTGEMRHITSFGVEFLAP